MAMGRSPGSLERGLCSAERSALDIIRMTSERDVDIVDKAQQYRLPLPTHSQDAPVRHRRTCAKMLFLLGVTFVAIIFMVLRIIPVNLIWFNGYESAWSKKCGSECGWRDALVLNIKSRPKSLADDPHVMHEIPQYVLDYAPLVHLYSEEQFWPCDIKEHLFHVTPELNYTPIQGLPQLNLTNLDQLNQFEEGRHVFLTSNDNVEDRPDWLSGQINIPDDYTDDAEFDSPRSQLTRDKSSEQRHGGHSDAPAVLLTVDKGDGIVDAFWFFFYSYNLGNLVFNIRFGNHIGDWEHTLIRFEHGKPKIVFVSEHFFGSAYNYSAVEKIENRVRTTLYLTEFYRLHETARRLFCGWYPCNVRNFRYTPLHTSSRSSSR